MDIKKGMWLENDNKKVRVARIRHDKCQLFYPADDKMPDTIGNRWWSRKELLKLGFIKESAEQNKKNIKKV